MEKCWDAMQNFPYNEGVRDNLKAVRIFFFNEYNIAQNTAVRLQKRITVCYLTGKNISGNTYPVLRVEKAEEIDHLEERDRQRQFRKMVGEQRMCS